MLVLVISLILIVAVLLIIAVLMQNSKGGLGSMGGSSAANQLIGVKKASDFLEKSTWVFIILILGLSVLANSLLKSDSAETENTPIGTEIEAPVNFNAAPSPQPIQNVPTQENTDEEEILFQEDAPANGEDQ